MPHALRKRFQKQWASLISNRFTAENRSRISLFRSSALNLCGDPPTSWDSFMSPVCIVTRMQIFENHRKTLKVLTNSCKRPRFLSHILYRPLIEVITDTHVFLSYNTKPSTISSQTEIARDRGRFAAKK